jgi:VanZ family protein
MKSIFWFWLPTIGYLAAIFFVSALPNPQIGGDTPDYVLHALEYFLLGLLLMRLLLFRSGSISPQKESEAWSVWRKCCLLGLMIAMGYGMTDEFHQYFVPNRNCSLQDWCADTFGASVAYGIAMLDYYFLQRYPAWLAFLQRSQWVQVVSYTGYWFKSSSI